MSIVAALLTLAALATWGGALHPAADTLAVMRLPLVALAGTAVIWTNWPRRLRWPLAGLALLVLGQAAGLKLTTPEPGAFTVYQKNLWYGNTGYRDVAQDILAQAPDVVTLQEVSRHNDPLLDLLRAEYPHQHRCNSYGWGVVVLSRHPMMPGQALCSTGRGLSGARVATPDGPVWVLSLHLFWPWPHEQRPQAEQIEALVDGLEGPVILSGDFNMVPWGSDVRRLALATGVERAGPMRPTYWLRLAGWPLAIPLPLDQVWATGGGRAELRPRLGSDHAGVLARVHLDAD
ncbi:endonuclease/exonuclease/phosphatase family protein [Mameliella sediminis]|uniref:endonuclease/exonuclease/phosphatase family protein n=1 Tax=Mameliella sediminis TaxID=2836866 RepID=UPI001C484C4D|nr:endonuclease/exonuclease/phosphatase family protein [Mameliella sediminis]